MFTLRVKVQEDGSILIKGLPVEPGNYYEVSIKPVKNPPDPDNPYPLRGLVNAEELHYYLPFEPADLENWEEVLEKATPYEREGDWTLLPPEELEELERGPSKENLV